MPGLKAALQNLVRACELMHAMFLNPLHPWRRYLSHMSRRCTNPLESAFTRIRVREHSCQGGRSVASLRSGEASDTLNPEPQTLNRFRAYMLPRPEALIGGNTEQLRGKHRAVASLLGDLQQTRIELDWTPQVLNH